MAAISRSRRSGSFAAPSITWKPGRIFGIEKLGYYGHSWGGRVGAIVLAVEPRLKVGVLNQAGINAGDHPDINVSHFLPRVDAPVLHFSGRYDTDFRFESSSKPFFDRLGTPPEHKKHVVSPTRAISCRCQSSRARRSTGSTSTWGPSNSLILGPPTRTIPPPFFRVFPRYFTMRTHYCGEIDESLVGQEIEVCGWVHRRRDHGGVIFIDLRDREGLLQVVFDPDRPEIFAEAERIRSEYVLKVKGLVRPRPEGTVNPNMRTGAGRGSRTRTRHPEQVGDAAVPP